jgi:hypothetical protein
MAAPFECAGAQLVQWALVAAFAALLSALAFDILRLPPNLCQMTYMWPHYVPVEVPHSQWGAPRSYSLMLYREGNVHPPDVASVQPC